jgi:hypothetical protein
MRKSASFAPACAQKSAAKKRSDTPPPTLVNLNARAAAAKMKLNEREQRDWQAII